MNKLLNIKEASKWASSYLDKDISTSNINYLIQYGRIPKKGNTSSVLVDINDLTNYYATQKNLDTQWDAKIGNVNWKLSFREYKESQTTKHIHRLHPYKGKFIPQLVEYFLDDHVDEFKTNIYFKKGDIVLDPFCGSGTTLAQANELEIHALGIDVSQFNAFISNAKIQRNDFALLEDTIQYITKALEEYAMNHDNIDFENELLQRLNIFNKQFFPSPEYKLNIRKGKFDEKQYGADKEQEFQLIFDSLVAKYHIQIKQDTLGKSFLDTWYIDPIRKEIDFVFGLIKKIDNISIKTILAIILSRTMRSCRATTHADLATLKQPVMSTYYCKKHSKICKPLFSILSWWKRYSLDTVKRLKEFNSLRTNTMQLCIQGDSRNIEIHDVLQQKNHAFAKLIKKQKISGIFSSPPYIGLIDYHEQHSYAYDLFGFTRNDELEIGPLFKGQGIKARKFYIEGIAQVLRNCKPYLQKDYNVFLVANDKYNVYPTIANKSGMKIISEYRRPVLNRTEKDKSAYSETIFHLIDNT